MSGDAGAFLGDGEVPEQEVGAHDASVLAERGGERGLRAGVLQACDEQAGRDPAALERGGQAEHVVVLLPDQRWSRAGAQDRIDLATGRSAEAVEAQVGGVFEARDEAPAEQVEQREDELGGAVGVGGVLGDRQVRVEDRLERVEGFALGDRDDLGAVLASADRLQAARPSGGSRGTPGVTVKMTRQIGVFLGLLAAAAVAFGVYRAMS